MIVAWQPQIGPQLDAIQATWCDEIFFGGARGGGKSDYLIGDFAQDVEEYGPAWRGVLFRESYPELEEIISRSHEIYSPMGAKFHGTERVWTWPNGATLKLRYIESERDAARYQGHQYTWIGWDELPKQKSFRTYKMLKACLRSAAGIPVKRIRASGNPGGAIHNEVMAYFAIDRWPKGYRPIDDPVTKSARMFIPSKVKDNKILLKNDPGYVDRLRGVGSEALVRAWLDGDWNAVLGAFFDEWDVTRHVVKPIALPEGWTRFAAFDWGSARPFSVGWYAVSDGELPQFKRGCLVKYREWYGCKPDEPNTGIKLTAEEVAEGILSRETGENISYRVADPAIFAQDGGPSIGERMARIGVAFRPADNKRVGQRGAMGGWDQMRARLSGEEGKPMLVFFHTCRDSIRTIPVLQHDDVRPEDVDTDQEDHAADETRYACASRPYQAEQIEHKRPIEAQPTFNDIMRESRRNQSDEDRRL